MLSKRLFSCFFIFIFVSLITFCCFLPRKVSQASTVTADKPLIVLPSIPLFTRESDRDIVGAGYIPSIYLGELNGEFIFYYALPDDTFANFNYSNPNLLPADTAVTFSPYYVDLSKTNTISIRELYLAGGATISISANISYDYLFQTCSYIGYEYLNNSITYYFFDSTRTVIASILINNVSLIYNTAMADYDFFVFTTISSAASTSELVSRAYQEGYDIGYNQGYSAGASSEQSVFSTIASSVNDLLDIELFGSFKISTLLYITFGMILLGIVIKVFLGG